MRSLFLKIFRWCWITAILTGMALVLTWVLQPSGVPARWHAALAETARVYGNAAVGEMERGGPPAAAAYLDDLHRNALTNACLFDAHGREIAGHACASFASLVASAAASPSAAFGMRWGIARVSLQMHGNGRRYIFATELPAGPRAAAGADRHSLALHWLVAFLVSGLICYLLALYLTAPILRLREASRGLAEGKLSTRVASGAEKRGDELGELVRDFNAMGDRIEALVSSQRQLISDISHELRSPLARLTVALDLARERKGDDPVFARMEKDYDRLGDMLARLLTVARLDSAIAPPEMTPVDLAELLSEIVADAEFESHDRNCTIQLSTDGEIHVQGNRELL